jgi:hypothetical protein
MPTWTPGEDTTTAPEKPEQTEAELATNYVFDDFSTPDSHPNPDRWQVNCSTGKFEDIGGSIKNGQLEFLNTADSETQECLLEVLRGERIPGEALGGIAAIMNEEHRSGEMNSNTWISFRSEMEEDGWLHAFCGVQTWPDVQLAIFGVIGPHDVSLFYNDMEIDPEMSRDFRLEADPTTMAIRCQLGDEVLGVWVPANPEELRQAEFARLVEISRQEGVVALSEVDDVRLLAPREVSRTECPEITDWKAEYWDNADLAGEPVLCRDEGFPMHFWASGSPAPEIPGDWFSARYTKEMEFDAGRYTFRLSGDDGVRLWLDDELLIDEWWNHGFTDYHAETDIPAGFHTLRVEYYEHGGEAHLELFASQDDQLLFSLEPGCIAPPEGLIGWWPGDGDASNQLGGEPGTEWQGISYAPGKIDQAFHFDPAGWEQTQAGGVDIPLIPEYEGLFVFTIEAWVYLDPDDPLPGQHEDFVRIGGKFRLGKDYEGRLTLTVPYESQDAYHLSGIETLPRGEWVHVVGVYNGEEMLLFQNAIPFGVAQVHFDLNSAASYFTLSNAAEPLGGMLDEVGLYNRPLNLGEIRLLYYAGGAHGKCK